jgi:hypothetical protein
MGDLLLKGESQRFLVFGIGIQGMRYEIKAGMTIELVLNLKRKNL